MEAESHGGGVDLMSKGSAKEETAAVATRWSCSSKPSPLAWHWGKLGVGAELRGLVGAVLTSPDARYSCINFDHRQIHQVTDYKHEHRMRLVFYVYVFIRQAVVSPLTASIHQCQEVHHASTICSATSASGFSRNLDLVIKLLAMSSSEAPQ